MKTMWDFFLQIAQDHCRAPLENIPGVKEYIGTDEGVVSSLLQVLMTVNFLTSRGNTPGVPGGWSGGRQRDMFSFSQQAQVLPALRALRQLGFIS